MSLAKYEATGEFAPRQLMIAIHGPFKSGKSRFAVTAPGPLFIANFDHEIDYLLNELCVGKEVYVDNIWPSGTVVSMSEVEQMVARLDIVVAQAFRVKKGTLVIDGVSKLYNYLQLKYLGVSYAGGKPQEGGVSQFQWARIYQHMTQLLQPFQQTDCNVVLTLESKKEYDTGTKTATGALIPRGPEAIGYTIHLQLQTFTKTQREAVVSGTTGPSVCVICGQPQGRGQHTEYWARFDWTAYRDSILRNREICNPTFDKVKALVSLQSAVSVPAEKELAAVTEPVVDLSKIGKGEAGE